MIDSKFNLDATSKQGALSGSRMTKNVAYTIQLQMKEGKWERMKPVIFDFFAAASVFLFEERRWNYGGNIRETKRDPTPYNAWKKIHVRIEHDFKNFAEADRFVEELKGE